MSENMQTCPSCGELVPIEYVLCVWCGYDLTAEHIRRSGIVIRRKEAFQRMVRVVRDPLNAFKEITLIPDLLGGRLVLYAIGIFMTLNMLTIFSKLNNAAFNANQAGTTHPPQLPIYHGFAIDVKAIIGFAFLIVMPLFLLLIFTIAWKISTRLLAGLSKTIGGTGNRDKIRSVIGYSLSPVAIGWILAWLIRLVTPKNGTTNYSNYSVIESAINSVSKQGFGVVGYVFIVIGWIYAAVLGIIGMSKASKLSIVESIIVAGIPYALFIWLIVL